MSHHIHTLLPLLPMEQPFKPEKVKRKRKLRAGQASSVDAADESDEVDGIFAVDTSMPRSQTLSAPLEEDVGQPPALGHFSGPAMKAMLQAQEDS